ncbi:unnamed protein product [Sphagnum troendelagicum]|uniref:Uncharacterized protein n=1 Tax=Sphagnum troendelagicum TaxID=128251 RepID=A0ABP0TCN0_9BRYO
MKSEAAYEDQHGEHEESSGIAGNQLEPATLESAAKRTEKPTEADRSKKMGMGVIIRLTMELSNVRVTVWLDVTDLKLSVMKQRRVMEEVRKVSLYFYQCLSKPVKR